MLDISDIIYQSAANVANVARLLLGVSYDMAHVVAKVWLRL